MLETAATPAAAVQCHKKLRCGKQSLPYQWPGPENQHTRVYEELVLELHPIRVYF